MMLNDQTVKFSSENEQTIVLDSSIGESIQRIQFVEVDESESTNKLFKEEKEE